MSWKLEAGSWELGAESRELGAGSRKLGAESLELGAGSWEPGAESWELGAGNWELGAASWEPKCVLGTFSLQQIIGGFFFHHKKTCKGTYNGRSAQYMYPPTPACQGVTRLWELVSLFLCY